MDKVYRRGVNVTIAFDVARKLGQLSAVASEGESVRPAANDSPIPDVDDSAREDSQRAMLSSSDVDQSAHEHLQQAAPSSVRKRIKSLLRPVARLVYRSLKPFAAPLLFRARRYFTEIPTQQLEHLGNSVQMHAQAWDERFAQNDAALQALREEIIATRHLLSQGSASSRMFMGEQTQALQKTTLNELRNTREVLWQINSQLRSDITALHSELENVRSRLEVVEGYSFASARRVALACDPGCVMVRTSVGYVLCPASDHALLALLVETGEVEAGTRKLIQALLRPGSTYVDVGANVGMHVLAAARAMQGRGKIICFEPYAATAALLKESAMINGFAGIVELYQAAVSASAGLMDLHLGRTSGHHSLFPLPATLMSGATQTQTKVLSLHDVISSQTRVDLLKIDVEGAELDVLKGATQIIQANPDIGLIVELGISHLQRVGAKLVDWLSAFESLGLKHMAIDADSGKLEAWSVSQLAQAESVNLFFARPAASVWQTLGAQNE